jgi:hypothetical protein
VISKLTINIKEAIRSFGRLSRCRKTLSITTLNSITDKPPKATPYTTLKSIMLCVGEKKISAIKQVLKTNVDNVKYLTSRMTFGVLIQVAANSAICK